MDGLKGWEGKQVYVKIKAGRFYSGQVIKVEETKEGTFITLLDHYNKQVMFSSSEIKLIQEEASVHAKSS